MYPLTVPLPLPSPALQAEQVSSVGIISHAHGGALVANLSVSDLRGLLPQHLMALSLTVLQFVTARASIAGWPAARHAPSNEWGLKGAEALKEPTPVTCGPGATLMQVRPGASCRGRGWGWGGWVYGSSSGCNMGAGQQHVLAG
jgi:hypothetical protein